MPSSEWALGVRAGQERREANLRIGGEFLHGGLSAIAAL